MCRLCPLCPVQNRAEESVAQGVVAQMGSPLLLEFLLKRHKRHKRHGIENAGGFYCVPLLVRSDIKRHKYQGQFPEATRLSGSTEPLQLRASVIGDGLNLPPIRRFIFVTARPGGDDP